MVILITIVLVCTSALMLQCTAAPPTTKGSSLSGSITISGSTTIQPVNELLAKAFHKNNTGVIVNVQGGGSGKGMTDVGEKLVDIGSASEQIPQSIMQKYPGIVVTQIGASAVVPIVNVQDNVNSINVDDLKKLYDNKQVEKPAAFKDFTVYKRAETSGTADTWSTYLFGDKSTVYDAVGTIGATGNPGVVDGVASAPKSIGFADFGFAENNPRVKIIGITDGKNSYPAATRENMLKVLKKTDTSLYPAGLTRPLNYITNGKPTPLVQAYIDYVLSPGAVWAFDKNGYFSMQEVK